MPMQPQDPPRLTCPTCHGHRFHFQYEVSYRYSYTIDEDAPGVCNHEKFFSFLYDNREQTASRQYLECKDCGTQYRCCLNDWNNDITIHELQQVLSAPALPSINTPST